MRLLEHELGRRRGDVLSLLRLLDLVEGRLQAGRPRDLLDQLPIDVCVTLVFRTTVLSLMKYGCRLDHSFLGSLGWTCTLVVQELLI